MKHILLLMMLFEVSLMGKAQSMSSKVVDKDSHEAIIGAVCMWVVLRKWQLSLILTGDFP